MKEKFVNVRFKITEDEFQRLIETLRCAHNCIVDELNGYRVEEVACYYTPKELKRVAELMCGFELDESDDWNKELKKNT